MIVDPIIEEDNDSVPKSSFQTQIDLYMEEIYNFVDQEIILFNERVNFRTVTKLDVYKKNNKKIEKAVNMEALVFSQTKTTLLQGTWPEVTTCWTN